MALALLALENILTIAVFAYLILNLEGWSKLWALLVLLNLNLWNHKKDGSDR
jgi:hypothetical protein